jgi:uncharacterized protein (TIGR03437 family)
MKRLATLLGFCAATLAAQTVETIPFRAVMLSSNETPLPAINASGTATILLHVVRNNAGQIISGSADFRVNYTFPGSVTLTGLHIHPGAPGVNGPATVRTSFDPIADSTGRGVIEQQAQVRPSDANFQDALAVLNGMLQNPGQYYVNLHTTINPDGAIRGQLQKAEMVVLMGMMSNANETPPVAVNASGLATVTALAIRDSSGKLTSGEVTFDVNYDFPGQTTFVGLHIHPGAAGVAGPAIIRTDLGAGAASVTSDSTGKGNIFRRVELPVNDAVAVSTFEALFASPGADYINLHTVTDPGGAIRAQLRNTDQMTFPMTLLPSNEVPPIAGLDASAPALLTVSTLRAPDGSVQAGSVTFDVNFRFPGRTQFRGLHVHNQIATENGPITLPTDLSAAHDIVTATGFGNVYKTVTIGDLTGVATLNSVVANPERHYVNLHTDANPGGAVRAQLSAANTALASVSVVTSANFDSSLRTFAPGELIRIYGSNLAKVGTGLGGFTGLTALPTALNGSQVKVAGNNAPLFYVGPDQIVAQIPFEATTGSQLVVTNSNGNGQAFNITVATAAPALFFDTVGGIVLKNSDFSLVRPENPASMNDILLVYSTGLGLTTPPVATGRLVTFPPASTTAPVTVTIGGQPAEVIYSIASPGFTGLYQTAVRMPAVTAAATAPVVLQAGSANSNTVSIAVR